MNRLVNLLEGYAIRDKSISKIMATVDRADFCPISPYEDNPQPIGFNATISAPHMHAYALEYAKEIVDKKGINLKVLDVGCGSGYLCVAFNRLLQGNGKIVGIEHLDGLVELSKQNIRKNWSPLLANGSIEILKGDGRLGYERLAPYDIIHVGAATSEVPPALVDQLTNGGMLIVPIGEYTQEITIITKDDQGSLSQKSTIPVRYIPLCEAKDQWSS